MAEAAGLYYETHGQPDAPPLILSSGLGGSASYWKPNIPALAEHFHVIAYDHRGTGSSDRTPLVSPSVADMADDVVALLDSLEIATSHFIGHALGGLIGLALAARMRERVGRLVVVNGWGRLESHTARCFDARLSLLRDSGVEAFVRAQPIFLYPANWIALHADEIEEDEKIAIAHFPGALTMEQRIAAARAFDVNDWMNEVWTPVLVYSTDDDMLVPSIASLKLVESLEGMMTTQARAPTGGHACNVTDPDTFNRIVLDFLRS